MSCGKRGYIIICLGWFIVDCVFELGQKFDTWSSRIIPDWFARIPFLENSENYFRKGTFDILDVVAIALGAAVAYFVILTTLTTNKRREIS